MVTLGDHYLKLGEAMNAFLDDSELVVLTGYGNIATAVTAVKLGDVPVEWDARQAAGVRTVDVLR